MGWSTQKREVTLTELKWRFTHSLGAEMVRAGRSQTGWGLRGLEKSQNTELRSRPKKKKQKVYCVNTKEGLFWSDNSDKTVPISREEDVLTTALFNHVLGWLDSDRYFWLVNEPSAYRLVQWDWQYKPETHSSRMDSVYEPKLENMMARNTKTGK